MITRPQPALGFRIRIDGTGIGLLCLHIMKKVLLIRNSILTDRLWKMELLSYWEVGVKLSKGIHFLTHVRNHYWGGWSKLFQYYVGVRAKWLQYFIDGVCPNDYNITWEGGGGGLWDAHMLLRNICWTPYLWWQISGAVGAGLIPSFSWARSPPHRET